jgi:membrane-associated protease RseP (regulator of RpoE activity)
MSEQYYFPSSGSEYYRPTIIHRLNPSDSSVPTRADAGEITFGRVLLHLFLLGLTAVTTTGMGALLFLGSDTAALTSGLLFSFTLLVILSTHEMGHYIACRWYKVRATLPYFIPAPLGIGTFGAFIKIKSPIPSRRALFDIGIAGPLAGFAFAVPAGLIAHYYAAAAPSVELSSDYMIFHSPLLFQLFERYLHLPPSIELNPIWFASWVGLLMTSLNLLPVGQLDGGHVVYAVFGRRGHWLIARLIYIGVLGLALHAWLRGGWMGWIIYAVLLTLILRIGHPPVVDEHEKLGFWRLAVAVIGLLVFLLCFLPVPISVVS